jgi:hypothetical protein
VASLALVLVDIPRAQVKPLDLSRNLSSPAGIWDGIALVSFVTMISLIPAAPLHPEMQFGIRAIDVYRDVSLSASDLMFLKCHFAVQIVKKDTIVNTRCFHTENHIRHWVLRLLDLSLYGSKSVFIHPLLVVLL